MFGISRKNILEMLLEVEEQSFFGVSESCTIILVFLRWRILYDVTVSGQVAVQGSQ